MVHLWTKFGYSYEQESWQGCGRAGGRARSWPEEEVDEEGRAGGRALEVRQVAVHVVELRAYALLALVAHLRHLSVVHLVGGPACTRTRTRPAVVAHQMPGHQTQRVQIPSIAQIQYIFYSIARYEYYICTNKIICSIEQFMHSMSNQPSNLVYDSWPALWSPLTPRKTSHWSLISENCAGGRRIISKIGIYVYSYNATRNVKIPTKTIQNWHFQEDLLN